MEQSSDKWDGSLGLRGLRVLVAEDEAVIALALEAALHDLGCVVLPAVPSVEAALTMLRAERPDIALLDLELADGSAAPVADTLAGMGVPFAVMTGHGRSTIADPLLRAAPYLGKPYGPEELRAALMALARLAAPPRYPMRPVA